VSLENVYLQKKKTVGLNKLKFNNTSKLNPTLVGAYGPVEGNATKQKNSKKRKLGTDGPSQAALPGAITSVIEQCCRNYPILFEIMECL
jgi:hypothetical protein